MAAKELDFSCQNNCTIEYDFSVMYLFWYKQLISTSFATAARMPRLLEMLASTSSSDSEKKAR